MKQAISQINLFKPLFKHFSNLFLIISSLFSSCFLQAANDETLFPLKETRFEVGYATGNFIGLDLDYLEVGAWTPALVCGDFLSFIDLKGYRFENSKWGSSAGLGLRYQCSDYVFGSNAYYDFLQGYYHNFNRIGVGLECLGFCWDFRVNGYFSVMNSEQHSRVQIFNDFQDENLCATRVQKEFTPRLGFDMEVGVPLGCWNQFSSYFAIGPYYYNWQHQKSYWGGQARLEFYWKSFVSVQVQTSYDRVNHSQTEGKFLFFFPLDVLCGGCWEDMCKILLSQPVVRNGTIFTDRCCEFRSNWD